MSKMDRSDLRMYAKMMQHPTGYVAGQLELTSACEQRCVNCQSWIDHTSGKEQGEWELRDVKKLFRSLSKIPTFEHLTLTGGDPQSWEDLGYLLPWFHTNRKDLRFKLRINTALPKLPMELEEARWWQFALQDLRVSLDAVNPEVYRAMRGVDRDPEEVLMALHRIDHPRTTTLTCVSEHNIRHVRDIVKRLRVARNNHLRLRKAIFIPVRPQNDKRLVQINTGTHRTQTDEWQTLWEELCTEFRGETWTSFGEQVTREDQPLRCDCHVGKITFHIKHNGDLYPCCLMGGEAIATRREFRIGNVLKEPIEHLWASYVANPVRNAYDDPNSACSRICLWKQTTMNRLGNKAEETVLSMP
jgi:radical SAM protein with 4Fe4S-binding SPASM domain